MLNEIIKSASKKIRTERIALGLTQEEFDALPTQLQESIKICYL